MSAAPTMRAGHATYTETAFPDAVAAGYFG